MAKVLVPVLDGKVYGEAVGYVRALEPAERERLTKDERYLAAALRDWPLDREDMDAIREAFPAVGFQRRVLDAMPTRTRYSGGRAEPGTRRTLGWSGIEYEVQA